MQQKVGLYEMFMSLQREMRSKLETGRECFGHPTAKGDDSENGWLEWFADYLPKRYDVKRAFVLDSKGNTSDQIDVVVFDRQYSPFLLSRDSACYIPAESVYAVLEVKQSMDRENIAYAREKAKSVRSLHRTSAPIPHAGGIYKPKELTPILSGILTYDCSWSPPFGEPFERSLETTHIDDRLDLGCAICNGSFEARYGDEGLEHLEVTTQESALVFFFLKLTARLQELGTVAAIDLDSYLETISPDLDS
jgi:hypothetical protein